MTAFAPQTLEADQPRRAAECPIVSRSTRCDKEGRPAREVKQESPTTARPLRLGGDTGDGAGERGIQTREHRQILEMILLVSRSRDLRPNSRSDGQRHRDLEANLDKANWPVATLLIPERHSSGAGDVWLRTHLGKVRADGG